MASLQPKLLNTLSALSHPRKGRFCDLGGFGVKPPTLTSPFSCGICGLRGSSPGCARVSIGVHCALHPRALRGLCLPSPGMASPCTHCQAGGRRGGLFTRLPLFPYSAVHLVSASYFFKESFPSIQLPEFTCRTFPHQRVLNE